MALGEFELIRRYFQQASGAPGVVRGVGDDCALLAVPAGQQLAVSMDTLVAGVHFPVGADPELIAERALRVNLSDLAAMGAEPLWLTLGLTLPAADEPWVQGFARGLWRVAQQYNIALVGGDTTRGPLTITVQVHGSVAPGQALLRSNASVGDGVYVTGTVGDGAAALAVIQQQWQVGESARDYLLGRYYRPEPRLAYGRALLGVAAAAIDISDGLVADLGHICEESGVGASVDLDKLPLSAPVRQLSVVETGLQWALTGGDDYELCFTVPPAHRAALERLMEQNLVQATCIGEITGGTGVTCFLKGQEVPLPHRGYQHFESHD